MCQGPGSYFSYRQLFFGSKFSTYPAIQNASSTTKNAYWRLLEISIMWFGLRFLKLNYRYNVTKNLFHKKNFRNIVIINKYNFRKLEGLVEKLVEETTI